MDRLSRTLLIVVAVAVALVALVVLLVPSMPPGDRPPDEGDGPRRPLGWIGAVGAPGPRCDAGDAPRIRKALAELGVQEAPLRRAHGVRRAGDRVLVPEAELATLRAGRMLDDVRVSLAVDVETEVGFFLASLPGDSLLDAIGFRQGDIVGAVSGWPLHDLTQAVRAWEALRAEDLVCVEFFREGTWRRLWIGAEAPE
ncbi:MAG: hypothetical protein H6732_07265 [Alphaproteobacteria bacterium]|nr:hypothetical protein [Alphaproteobacteria bacterium]